ncbi:MAG: hypothetical protein ACT4P9_15705 [Betaproteobacteria bacterium]
MNSTKDEAAIEQLIARIHAALARLRTDDRSDNGGRFAEPDARVMTPECLSELGGGSREEILAALVRHWTQCGEPGLVALAPDLAALAKLLALAPEDDADGAPRDDLYRMF